MKYGELITQYSLEVDWLKKENEQLKARVAELEYIVVEYDLVCSAANDLCQVYENNRDFADIVKYIGPLAKLGRNMRRLKETRTAQEKE